MLHLELDQLAWLGRSLAAPERIDARGRELVRWLMRHVPDPTEIPASWNLVAHWLRRWARGGFPTLTVGPRRAAALMTADVPVAEIRRIVPPWPAYLLVLNDPVLWVNGSVERDPVERVLVCHQYDLRYGLTWHVAVGARHGDLIYGTHVLPEELTSKPSRAAGQARGEDAATDWEARVMLLACRLVVGAALELSVPEALATAKLRASFRSQQAPALTHYELGDGGVEVDVRGAVRAYLTGHGPVPWTADTHSVSGSGT